MKLDVFADANKSELSMLEVAHAILDEKGETMAFVDIVNEIQTYLGKSDEEVRKRLPQFYTDLNADGGFISLGDNVWGLRDWYPFDSVDEEVNHADEEDTPKRKKRKKVNAFLADAGDDDDVIDYNDDDPEDDDFDDADDDSDDADAFDDDADADADNDDEPDALPDGIEGQLAEFGDDEAEDNEAADNADFSGDDDASDDDDDSDDSSDL